MPVKTVDQAIKELTLDYREPQRAIEEFCSLAEHLASDLHCVSAK